MNCPRCRRKAEFLFSSMDLEGYDVYECYNCGADFYVERWDGDETEEENTKHIATTER